MATCVCLTQGSKHSATSLWTSEREPFNSLALACLLASQDRTCEAVEDTESGRMVKKMKKRICLVLDCLCAHDFSDKTADLINLQHYVIKEKRLSERETVVIFYDVVRVVEALHQVRPRTHMPQKKSIVLGFCSAKTAWF